LSFIQNQDPHRTGVGGKARGTASVQAVLERPPSASLPRLHNKKVKLNKYAKQNKA